MDWLEEVTTRQADAILANSQFTANVCRTYLPSITKSIEVVYPGINIEAYGEPDVVDDDIRQVRSDRPTLLSLNRFEKKKNVALAVQSFAKLKLRVQHRRNLRDMRLVIAGGYDPRLENNLMTLVSLIDTIKSLQLTFTICKPSASNIELPPFSSSTSTHTNPRAVDRDSPSPPSSPITSHLQPSFFSSPHASSSLSSSTPPTSPSVSAPPPPITSQTPNPHTTDVLILLNFSAPQRAHLLHASSTLALLYTPANEHFGIGPLEGMIAGLPVLACDSGGPRETILTGDDDGRTGWLVEPDAEKWTEALVEIVNLSDSFPPQPSRPSLPIPSPSSQPSSSTPSSSNSSFEHIQAKEPETARTALALRAKTRDRKSVV